jgi:hypothetical protein
MGYRPDHPLIPQQGNGAARGRPADAEDICQLFLAGQHRAGLQLACLDTVAQPSGDLPVRRFLAAGINLRVLPRSAAKAAALRGRARPPLLAGQYAQAGGEATAGKRQMEAGSA